MTGGWTSFFDFQQTHIRHKKPHAQKEGISQMQHLGLSSLAARQELGKEAQAFWRIFFFFFLWLPENTSQLKSITFTFEWQKTQNTRTKHQDFPGGPVVKNLPANAGDTGLIPNPGRSHMLLNN